MDRKKNRQFRELLEKPGLISVPVCYDAISARMIESLGFEMMAMGGNGAMASLLGYPDLGLATATEMIGRARQIAARIDIPLFVDADTGYGNILNVRRTVIEYEAAGASGIQLEDQDTPRKSSNLQEIRLVSAEEAAERIEVAVKAKRDPNTVIIAKTDCYYMDQNVDEAIRRAKMFVDAGADIIMPAGGIDQNIDDLGKFVQALKNVPVVADVAAKTREPLSDQKLEEMGFKMVTCGLASLLYVCQALKDLLTHYKQTGSLGSFMDRAMDMKEYEQLIGRNEEYGIHKWLSNGSKDSHA